MSYVLEIRARALAAEILNEGMHAVRMPPSGYVVRRPIPGGVPAERIERWAEAREEPVFERWNLEFGREIREAKVRRADGAGTDAADAVVRTGERHPRVFVRTVGGRGMLGARIRLGRLAQERTGEEQGGQEVGSEGSHVLRLVLQAA